MRCLPRTNSATGTRVASAPLRRNGAAGSEEEVFYQLLGKGGTSARAAALHIFFSSVLQLFPIEAMVLIEARVLRGDDSVLQLRRDLAERNECVVFLIRLVVHPGLKAALDVHRGGWRVNPPCGYKGQCCKCP